VALIVTAFKMCRYKKMDLTIRNILKRKDNKGFCFSTSRRISTFHATVSGITLSPGDFSEVVSVIPMGPLPPEMISPFVVATLLTRLDFQVLRKASTWSGRFRMRFSLFFSSSSQNWEGRKCKIMSCLMLNRALQNSLSNSGRPSWRPGNS
jgi:hypothetical protein